MITAAEWFADRDKQYEAEINAIVARIDAALCGAGKMPVRVSVDPPPGRAVEDAVQSVLREAGWRSDLFDEYGPKSAKMVARLFVVYGRRL